MSGSKDKKRHKDDKESKVEEIKTLVNTGFSKITNTLHEFKIEMTKMSGEINSLNKWSKAHNGQHIQAMTDAERRVDRRQQKIMFWANVIVRIVIAIGVTVTTLKYNNLI